MPSISITFVKGFVGQILGLSKADLPAVGTLNLIPYDTYTGSSSPASFVRIFSFLMRYIFDFKGISNSKSSLVSLERARQ